uniref:Uncharacterized protein n=1 Tax=Oryzias latipes TaxID=8090 RepID=A0A3B3H718_ORYLA
MADRSQLAEELKRWCRGEGLEEVKALMIMVPEEVETAEIEETIQTVKCLGQVCARGQMFHPTQNCVMVLCECKEDCNENVPPEVFHAGSETSWPIITLSEAPVPSDFSFKLKALMDAEGKTMNDIKRLLPELVPQVSATESMLQAVGDFLQKLFDQWLEQAWLMVEEKADPEAKPTVYLEALESSFGTAESGDDLYFAFRLMQQQPTEKLSDFLRRLERALSKVVQRGGFSADYKERARLEQLLRGAVASDLMLISEKERMHPLLSCSS